VADVPYPDGRELAVTVILMLSTALAGCGPVGDLGQAAGDGRQQPARYQPSDIAGARLDRGAQVMRQAYGCGACHVIPGVTGAGGIVGPPLNNWSRRVYIAGNLPNTPENLVRWIRHPQAVEPGTAMPDLGVTEADARDIAAYLYSLR
jgi:cytochrome c1